MLRMGFAAAGLRRSRVRLFAISCWKFSSVVRCEWVSRLLWWVSRACACCCACSNRMCVVPNVFAFSPACASHSFAVCVSAAERWLIWNCLSVNWSFLFFIHLFSRDQTIGVKNRLHIWNVRGRLTLKDKIRLLIDPFRKHTCAVHSHKGAMTWQQQHWQDSN